MITRGYLVHALSPLHPGIGQGVGLIDLPIAREATTNHPLLPGSSVKGVLRAEARERADADGLESRLWRLFGPDQDNASAYPGALRVSDARILLFPVRSDRGTFAWITAPMVLHRFLRAVTSDQAGFSASDIPSPEEGQAAVVGQSALVDRDAIVLDGLPFRESRLETRLAGGLSQALFPDEPYWRDTLAIRLCVLHDDLFGWLVEQATDVRAHIRIGEGGTVEQGALWYEETLPPETVLAGIVQYAPNGEEITAEDAWEVLGDVTRAPIQLGGGATTGLGLARLRLLGGCS